MEYGENILSNLTSERLYNLLPAIYRQRDVAEGEPLRALLAVIEGEVDLLTEDIAGLYDNWFIETCEEWVVPYIGDLLGVGGLSGETNHLFSQRAHVANAIGYRRRKGAPAILERAAQDITDWKARVVEYFELLSSTQHFDNVRLSEGRSFNLRDKLAVARMNTPFERAASLVDVRRITSKRGKQNIPNVGLFLWRLESYPMTHAIPHEVKEGWYMFHPFGVEMPLFNRPQPKTELTERTQEVHVPYRLTRQAFAADLKAYQTQHKSTPTSQQPANSQSYGPERSFLIMQDGNPIPPMNLVSRDLSNWVAPPTGKVAVDVELGRFAFAAGEEPQQTVLVSYNYAFSADIGGGPYDRRQSLAVASASTLHLQVSQNDAGESQHDFNDLKDALTAWAADNKAGIIEIMDNRTYDISTLSLDLSTTRQLVIQAADGMRPSLKGTLTVRGTGSDGKLTLNGLLIEDGIKLDGSFNLSITHSTLMSHGIQLVQNATGAHHNLQIKITDSLLGPIHLPPEIAGLTIQDSVIDGKAGSAIAADHQGHEYGPSTSLVRVTVFGAVKVKALTASEVIFTEQVEVQQRQAGNVRFSYIPPGSKTGQRYRCQPELAVASAIEEAKKKEPNLSQDKQNEIRGNIHLQLQPRFTSTEYGQAGYAQLSTQCAPEIASGAENESEMGAFQQLLQPQRKANLQASLNEYLRTGLEAGIFYVT
jgi:hypothetical protein